MSHNNPLHPGSHIINQQTLPKGTPKKSLNLDMIKDFNQVYDKIAPRLNMNDTNNALNNVVELAHNHHMYSNSPDYPKMDLKGLIDHCKDSQQVTGMVHSFLLLKDIIRTALEEEQNYHVMLANEPMRSQQMMKLEDNVKKVADNLNDACH